VGVKLGLTALAKNVTTLS